MANLLVRIRVRAYISDVIRHRLEKVRNGNRFENLKKDIDLRIGRRFENLKKGHRSEVQMSGVKIDIDLRFGCRLEAERRSEFYKRI